MATSNSPLQDPIPGIDGPDLLPPINTPNPEDLGEGVPLGEPEEPGERESPTTIRDRW